jgi:hypothetical protein
MIVGVTGKAGAGKDTFARRLIERHGYVKHSFAAPLKALVADQFGWDLGRLEELDYKEEKPLNSDGTFQCPGPDGIGLTRREVLIRIGTDGFRGCDPDFWVKRSLDTRIELHPSDVVANLVFPDVRFLNEAEGIRRRGGCIVRVVREGGPPGTSASGSVSETEMDRIEPDVIVRAKWGELDVLAAGADYVAHGAWRATVRPDIFPYERRTGFIFPSLGVRV